MMNNVAGIMTFIWGCLFTFNSLGTCVMIGLSNSIWTQMPTQAKVLLCVSIFINWSNTMMAFISKIASRLEQGKPLLPLLAGSPDVFTKPKP